jgi:phospholipid/cholesterol/gamma-HCH transport system substrate-binding protein
MLHSRTIKEGSVGLFILLGLLVFGGVIFWLRGSRFRTDSYQIIVAFENAGGLREGAKVRYRGIEVGKIVNINPGSNGVDIVVEIGEALRIPREVEIQTTRYGLLGETVIEIFPQKELTAQGESISPISDECRESKLIICDRERLEGEVGAQLVESLTRLSELYSSPEFYNNLNSAAKNTSLAGAKVAALSDKMSVFTEQIKQDISKISKTADAFTQTANATTEQITKLGDEFRTTSRQINLLVTNLNEVIDRNKYNFSEAIARVTDTSEQLSYLLKDLDFTVTEFNNTLTATDTQKIGRDLEELSENLREISEQLNKPTNLVALQETLDSARVTFANTAKITSDLDQLTGDPEFRINVKKLVNGLSNLLSYRETLEQQIELAKILNTAQKFSQNSKNNEVTIDIIERQFPTVMYIKPNNISNHIDVKSFSK